jgi:hypothetical protein
MHACSRCGGSIGAAFRYCPWCAAPQRAKLVEFFSGTGAEIGKALRVSRYTTEGHVRFSVWDESGTAEAAVSVDEEEARRLAAFLDAPSRQPSLLERFRL